MSEHFEVIFRGDVELGRSVLEVKEGLAKLFNAEASRIDQMFSGKPVVIKANLNEETALRYQASLKTVGAFKRHQKIPPLLILIQHRWKLSPILGI